MHLTATLSTSLLSASVVAREEAPFETPADIAEPAFPHCKYFTRALPGDTCNAIIRLRNVEADEFYRLNPSIGGPGGCNAGTLIAGRTYCIRALEGYGPDEPPREQHPPPEPTRPRQKPTGDRLEQPSSTTEDLPYNEIPSLTPVPPAPSTCEWGACWRAFVDISTAHNENANMHASVTCSYIYNMPCVHSELNLPPRLLSGCDSCEMLSSGCPCWLERKYHTKTADFEDGDGCGNDDDAFDDGVC